MGVSRPFRDDLGCFEPHPDGVSESLGALATGITACFRDTKDRGEFGPVARWLHGREHRYVKHGKAFQHADEPARPRPVGRQMQVAAPAG